MTVDQNKTRLQLFRVVKSAIKNNIDFDNFDISQLFSSVNLIGQGVQGKVYKCILKKEYRNEKYPKLFTLVIKNTELDKPEIRNVDDIFSKKALRKSPFIENASNLLANELVKQKICPNFVLSYYSQYSTKCVDKKKDCMLYFNEFVNNGTFQDWYSIPRTSKEWFNALFQIFAGIYALQKYFNLIHADLHDENVLVQKIPEGGYWKYRIDGVNYHVPNLGFRFFIADFGYSWIPTHLTLDWYHNQTLKKFKKGERYFFDIKKLTNILKLNRHAPKDVKEYFKTIRNYYIKSQIHLSEIINTVYGNSYNDSTNQICKEKSWYCYQLKPKNIKKYLVEFNIDKKMKKTGLPKQLQHLILN
jgi:hypothetical protein